MEEELNKNVKRDSKERIAVTTRWGQALGF